MPPEYMGLARRAKFLGLSRSLRARSGGMEPPMTERIVHCRHLKKDLPGLDRPPYKNELGRQIYEEVSKEAWQQWLKDSVKYINTYRVDLASSEGQKFMLEQCAKYFGYQEGDLAATAFVPTPGAPEPK
jgi:Fe-S cluster biosynthesis and repair protein YggX